MRFFLIGYKCYFAWARERTFAVEAESKNEAVQKAIEAKRNDAQASIECGGVKWDSFRVIKKLQPPKISREEEAVAGDYCESLGETKTKANIRRRLKHLEGRRL